MRYFKINLFDILIAHSTWIHTFETCLEYIISCLDNCFLLLVLDSTYKVALMAKNSTSKLKPLSTEPHPFLLYNL